MFTILSNSHIMLNFYIIFLIWTHTHVHGLSQKQFETNCPNRKSGKPSECFVLLYVENLLANGHRKAILYKISPYAL